MHDTRQANTAIDAVRWQRMASGWLKHRYPDAGQRWQQLATR